MRTSSALPEAARLRALVLPAGAETGTTFVAGAPLELGLGPATLLTPSPPTPMPTPIPPDVDVRRVKEDLLASPTAIPAYGSEGVENGERGLYEDWPGTRCREDVVGGIEGLLRSMSLDALDWPLFGSSSGSLVGRLSDP